MAWWRESTGNHGFTSPSMFVASCKSFTSMVWEASTSAIKNPWKKHGNFGSLCGLIITSTMALQKCCGNPRVFLRSSTEDFSRSRRLGPGGRPGDDFRRWSSKRCTKRTCSPVSGLWYTYPSEKIWVRELGWWNSQLNGKIKDVPNHQPVLDFRISLFRSCLGSKKRDYWSFTKQECLLYSNEQMVDGWLFSVPVHQCTDVKSWTKWIHPNRQELPDRLKSNLPLF